MVKLPAAPPPEVLRGIPPDVKEVPAGTSFVRLFATAGSFPTTWNSFRYWGPHPRGGRFDHHQPPPSVQERGILYFARHPLSCFAEYFQQDRIIRRSDGATYLAVVRFRRQLRLLDLTGLWPTRAGASVVIASGPRPRVQAWARAIYAAYPDLDGVSYGSSMAGNAPCLALTERAAGALPSAPASHRALSDAVFDDLVEIAAHALGYRVLP